MIGGPLRGGRGVGNKLGADAIVESHAPPFRPSLCQCHVADEPNGRLPPQRFSRRRSEGFFGSSETMRLPLIISSSALS